MLSIFSQIKLHAEDSPERHLSQQRAEQDQQQCSCIVGYGWVLRWSSYFASGILAGFPWAKERCMVQAVSGSTPITLASGFRSFTAVATPAKSPPPPQQTTTVSRSGTYENCTFSCQRWISKEYIWQMCDSRCATHSCYVKTCSTSSKPRLAWPAMRCLQSKG